MKQIAIKRNVQIALLIAIEILLTFTPLGFIYIPFLGINATLVHIPVLVGGALLGAGPGALLGTVFGICSMANSTLRPGLTAFVFSPFVSAGLFGFSGILRSIVIALIPRILVGVVAGLLGSLLRRKAGGRKWYFLPGLVGSFTNTVLVMTGIYLLYGPAYAAALGKSYSALLLYIFGVVGVNGTCEAVLAAVVTAAAVPALLKAGD